jgi:D-glycero-alpha-D-manno-heptose-7-phosphate kinase
MYAYCIIEPRHDGQVVFRAADLGREETHPVAPILPVSPALPLHTGVYNRIVGDFGAFFHSTALGNASGKVGGSTDGSAPGLRMTTYSDAPAGSGLGSSSTMVVAMVKAFVEWLNLPLGDYDIASLAYRIEREDLGLAGGRQDQSAATFGGFNFMEFSQGDKVIVNPLRLKKWIRNELEASLVLYYTGVSRESANIIKEQEANTREDKPEHLEGMHELKRQAVVMKEALLTGNFAGFSACLLRSWEAKKASAASISNTLIDDLYRFALSHGAQSAKISGAGGGGFMMIYCKPEDRMDLVQALKTQAGRVLTPSFTETGTQAWTIYNT